MCAHAKHCVREKFRQRERTNLSQPPSNGAGLLDTEIERKVLLALVELSKILALLVVGDSQNACYRFADSMTKQSISVRPSI